MMQTTFHNTCALTGDDLKKAVCDASKQEESILLIFLHTRKPFTASKITELTNKAGKNWPIWSNRRALTNLKSKGELIMHGNTVIGPQGKPEHPYQLNFNKYPTPPLKQSNLFQ